MKQSATFKDLVQAGVIVATINGNDTTYSVNEVCKLFIEGVVDYDSTMCYVEDIEVSTINGVDTIIYHAPKSDALLERNSLAVMEVTVYNRVLIKTGE